MTNSMRAEAEASRDAKLRRMGLQVRTADEYDDRGDGHTGPAGDGSQGKASGGYADKFSTNGGKTAKGVVESTTAPTGKRGAKRLDRGAYASGGRVAKKAKGTTVNVIVASPPHGIASPGMPSPGGMPMPAPGAVPVPLPAAVPPMQGAGGMPALRKRGGRVASMTAGAGSGEGREQKIRAYGKRAREGAANKNG